MDGREAPRGVGANTRFAVAGNTADSIFGNTTASTSGSRNIAIATHTNIVIATHTNIVIAAPEPQSITGPQSGAQAKASLSRTAPAAQSLGNMENFDGGGVPFLDYYGTRQRWRDSSLAASRRDSSLT
jgi:hypothetical protein